MLKVTKPALLALYDAPAANVTGVVVWSTQPAPVMLWNVGRAPAPLLVNTWPVVPTLATL